ncbi:unnamed protein product [Rotaria sp. Silwood1]|nr:unnamed protein product [Rotaria sp. Silwood1]
MNNNDEAIDDDNDDEEMLTEMMSSQMYLTPLDVLKHFEKIWTNEKEVLTIYLAALRSPQHSITHVHNNPISLFFFEVLPGLPSKFRPSRTSLTNTLRGATNEEQLNNLWLKMQITVNSIFDSSLDNRSGARVAKGIRQGIEKKEGLFRMHMMGKRVNYAGRSVISPDPFIAIYEVGIPGNVHPGANFVELDDGTIRRLLPNNLSQRTAVSKLLLTREKQHSNTALMSTKRVYRHLRTGNYVLVNRQLTLHRPSIQAHMKTEKTQINYVRFARHRCLIRSSFHNMFVKQWCLFYI